tara:strand:+ start:1628 stop:1954 length:327 start_codon:yes stop_codon:yes gene_type:complete
MTIEKELNKIEEIKNKLLNEARSAESRLTVLKNIQLCENDVGHNWQVTHAKGELTSVTQLYIACKNCGCFVDLTYMKWEDATESVPIMINFDGITHSLTSWLNGDEEE